MEWPSRRTVPLGLGSGASLFYLIGSRERPEGKDRPEGFFGSISATGLGQAQERSAGDLLVQLARLRTQRTHPRSRELAWRRAHEHELLALAGEWVIVEGEELIAHGHDPGRLVAEARARGIQVPYVFFVEPSGENTVRLGL